MLAGTRQLLIRTRVALLNTSRPVDDLAVLANLERSLRHSHIGLGGAGQWSAVASLVGEPFFDGLGALDEGRICIAGEYRAERVWLAVWGSRRKGLRFIRDALTIIALIAVFGLAATTATASKFGSDFSSQAVRAMLDGVILGSSAWPPSRSMPERGYSSGPPIAPMTGDARRVQPPWWLNRLLAPPAVLKRFGPRVNGPVIGWCLP
jgi:hypothetical protein